MAEHKKLLGITELSQQTGLSTSTIHRLKNAGRIPFYQPAGKCGRLLFPADAIEQAAQMSEPRAAALAPADRTTRLSGRPPKWTQSPPKQPRNE